MTETLQELLEFTKIFNQSEPVFKALVGDPAAVENALTPGQYATHGDINHGAISNLTEYERRLARFLIDMLRLDLAQAEYLDAIANGYLGIARPLGYTDPSYFLYVKNRVLSQKESAVAIKELLQPFSSQPVMILESGDQFQVMYSDCSYADWNPFTHDNADNSPVTPDILGGDYAEGTMIYYFRVRLQPIDAVAEKIIVALLKLAHVAGVGYDLEYYAPFP